MIGTGLIGTSIALALSERGVTVWLTDQNPAAARLAADIGAGKVLPGPSAAADGPDPAELGQARGTGQARNRASADWARRNGQPQQNRVRPCRTRPKPGGAGRAHAGAGAPPGRRPNGEGTPWADLAVLAVPPCRRRAFARGRPGAPPGPLVHRRRQREGAPAAPGQRAGLRPHSFVPGHPLSGRERSGPAAARGRPVPRPPMGDLPGTAGPARRRSRPSSTLVRCCRGEPVQVGADEHDRWVALVSHAPHVVAAAMAAQLTDAPGGVRSAWRARDCAT